MMQTGMIGIEQASHEYVTSSPLSGHPPSAGEVAIRACDSMPSLAIEEYLQAVLLDAAFDAGLQADSSVLVSGIWFIYSYCMPIWRSMATLIRVNILSIPTMSRTSPRCLVLATGQRRRFRRRGYTSITEPL